ncbi:MAG: DUF1566 domain-containing protein [Marinicella sp.]|nr:DUF1566 domain-containing protein [Xanthomonadales bacterium]
MKVRFLLVLLLLATCNYATANSEFIYRSGFEFALKLNDTGITWAAEFPSGNNLNCSITGTNTSPQDCNDGRDVLFNDDSDGHAGFSYTKLDFSGNPLPASAISWNCVKDNVTGLIWEVKLVNVGNIHYYENTYKWGGLTAIGLGTGPGTYYSDWNDLVNGSNNESLCGLNNWRVPTVSEFSTLINKDANSPAIDADYFPYTASISPNLLFFWTSSPIANPGNQGYAWSINFITGTNSFRDRTVTQRVRLVSSGQ